MISTYQVSGMHCRSCEAKVAAALKSVPGVANAEVSVADKRAVVDHADDVADDALRDAVKSAGDYSIEKQRSEATLAKHDEGHDHAHAAHGDTASAAESEGSLYPLVLIVGFIAGVVGLIAFAAGEFVWPTVMRHFMAGFFIVFAFFKLLDPPGFVSAYRGYDLLARRSAAWAWAYPYVELALGVAYLLNLWVIPVNVVTLVLMLIGAAGVLKALLDKRAIRCACLGAALNLPMTKVTLIEDLTMAVMAGVMLIVVGLG